MNKALLASLKKLQKQRGISPPFATHLDFENWADAVLPLLAFDPRAEREFKSLLVTIQVSRPFRSEEQENININNLIGILNRAITSLEANAKPNPAAHPAASPPDTPDHWYQKPLGVTWLAVAGSVLSAIAIYLVSNWLGISL